MSELYENPKILRYELLLSFNPLFKSDNLRKIIQENKDICVYPSHIDIAIQMYESNIDFKPLNKAITFEDYNSIAHLFPEKLGEKFSMFIKDFESSVYSVDTYCSLKNFIIFPLRIQFYDKYNKDFKFVGYHASLAILDKNNNRIYIIDSDNIKNKDKDVGYNEKKYESYLCKKVKHCIEKIMDKNYTITFLDFRTPQSITKDNYCIFWSMALTKELFSGKEFNPKKTLKNFLLKYNSKEKLKKYIQKFIFDSIKNV
jgi:hypothetical protein